MATIHINASKDEIANIVLMPGDPLRAKFIAENFLTDTKLINFTRNILGYTGYYKDKKVTVFSSGMGNPSIGIYSYELFNDYDVDYIIRIGTCGSYKEDIKIFDLILVDDVYSDSSYGKSLDYDKEIIESSKETNKIIEETAKKEGINIISGNIHCTDTFYNKDYSKALKHGCVGVEMETYALFVNAKMFNKKASAILTVSDNLITKNAITSNEREKSTIKMITLALETALNL